MKRYAAHFIFIPEYGYLKQYVVEVEKGCVVSVFPLTEEMEGVEWFPGVIALLTDKDDISAKLHDIFQKQKEVLKKVPETLYKEPFFARLVPYLFYPFDFTTMQPVGGTRHRQLL
ncbi:hypothetical protein [uncultured Bacteroides sp.]|uniref:hypothetical protein n=1 Tax=uncultured Bacteroides sp. TaxID=162156 RepID=UPI0025D88832|nr:hypothetical protein [uncultured Bacteroides sp.]